MSNKVKKRSDIRAKGDLHLRLPDDLELALRRKAFDEHRDVSGQAIHWLRVAMEADKA